MYRRVCRPGRERHHPSGSPLCDELLNETLFRSLPHSSITEGADYDRSGCPDRPAVAPMLRMPAIMSHCSAKTALTNQLVAHAGRAAQITVDIAQIQPRHLNHTS